MESFQRVVRVIALLALLMTSIVLYAQESTEAPAAETTEVVATEAVPEATEAVATAAPEMTGSSAAIVGSGIVNPILNSLTVSSGSIVNYGFTNTGTDSGFDEFCAGNADVATAIRPINTTEDTACREAGVNYVELLLGYDIMVFVANPEDDFLACLTLDNMNNIFAPSVSGQTTNWDQVNLLDLNPAVNPSPVAEATVELTAEPEVLPNLTVLVSPDNTLAYATLDRFVAGIGIRNDAVVADYQSIVNTVATTRGAIGVVPLEAALSSESKVFILEADFGSGIGCQTASVTSVEDKLYLAATPLYLYVNTNAQATLAFFLNYITNDSRVDAIVSAGFSPASADVFATNRAVISGEAPARAFSAEEVSFEIPEGLLDEVFVGGATSAFRFADAISTRLTSTQQSLTMTLNLNGQVAGAENFCNSTVDILFVNGNGENVCGGTSLNYFNYPLGFQAVVLVANAGDSYAACLTLDQISSIWGAASTNSVTQWNNVAESFPEQAITLFGVREGDFLTDILLTPAGGGAPQPVRLDVAETNNDPSYRSAATANVPGALTYMAWQNYERVIGNGQQNIQLVAVNAGDGCVVPSVETITNGTYPLARQTTMLVKELSLARTAVQSYVWTMFDDSSYSIFGASYFLGIEADALPQLRADVLAHFEQAAEAAQIAAETTPEATAEATEASGD
jgi:phosphate transport system substrate-binding protein